VRIVNLSITEGVTTFQIAPDDRRTGSAMTVVLDLTSRHGVLEGKVTCADDWVDKALRYSQNLDTANATR